MVKGTAKKEEPRIGIFFIIDSKIHYIWEPLIKYKSGKEYIDSSFSHYDFFWSLKCKYPKYRDDDYEYEEFSRGRVLYNVKEKTFYIFGDPLIIHDAKYYRKLIKGFRLQNQKIKIENDEHYIRKVTSLEI